MASGTDPDVEDVSHKITFESWQPEPPAGLNFLSLLPLGDQGYTAREYLDSEAPGKSKVSVQQRKQRRHAFGMGKTIGRDIRDEKRLKQAVEMGDLSSASKLIQMGIDPCCHDSKNRTPLHIAAAKGNKDLVKMLLDSGADPNQRDQIGNTALHLAACTRNTNIVTLLLQAGTDVNALDQTGRTPLHLATGRLRILQNSSQYSHTELKSEVSNIIDMMKVYLSKTKGEDSVTQLNDITHRLEQTSTKAEVDQLGSLLSDFASLQLSGAGTSIETPSTGKIDDNQSTERLDTSCNSSYHTDLSQSLSPQQPLVGSSENQYSMYRDVDKEQVASIPSAARYIQPR